MSSGSIVTCTRGRWAGKRATIDTALVGARTRGRLVLLVVVGLVGRNRLLDVLERQTQLLGVELLRMAAKLRTLQLAQQMPQAVVLRQGMVALHERGVTLRPRRSDQRMQGCDIGWKRIGALAHARDESDSRASVTRNLQPDSISHSSHDVAVGRRTSWA